MIPQVRRVQPDQHRAGPSAVGRERLPARSATRGILAAFVYGIWFFLAIEGVPLAAEETRDPKRDMPRGLIAGMLVLLVFAALILFTAAGARRRRRRSRTPTTRCPTAIERGLRRATTSSSDFVNYVGLAGLIASFFSIIFAYSRQLFALSRAGYLPRVLSVTSGRKTPDVALLVPGAIGFLLAAITEDGAMLINIAVFGATVSYVLMMLSHIVLRAARAGPRAALPDARRRR